MNTTAIIDLIKKTSDLDKDERYMATNDLINHLSRDIKIDEVLEKKICVAIIKQLDDKSNDVQSVAVKCLGVLVKKVHLQQIVEISDKLCELILDSSKNELRDIHSIGLKTLISDIPDDSISSIVNVVKKITKNLIIGISRSGSDDTNKECIDIMSDLLKRFGHLLTTSEQEDVMKCVTAKLSSDKQVIRKRAALCLGCLSASLTDLLLNNLVELLLEQYNVSGLDTRILIQTFGTISRTVGHRLGNFLISIVYMLH